MLDKRRRQSIMIKRCELQLPRNDERRDTHTANWCPHCLQVGIIVQLGPRLYKKEELIDGELPHDSFDWLECCDCGHIVEELV